MNNFVVLDLETESKEKFGRTANPWFNKILAYSIKDIKYQITNYCYQEDDIETLVDLIIQYDTVVAHSAKFECLYLWKYSKFQEWLKKGGKIYCTQLAEYYITNYQTQWAKLRTIATDKYKCPVRSKHIDDLLFKNKDAKYKCVSELPTELVLEDVDSDVKDTFDVYTQQQEYLISLGKTFRNLLGNQMEDLLATTEMEYNGFAYDAKVAKEDQVILEKELVVCEKELNILVDKYWRIE